MSARDGGPAFPREDYQSDNAPGQTGMTLRDWFAGQALAGLLAKTPFHDAEGNQFAMAKVAYGLADAMLAERNKP